MGVEADRDARSKPGDPIAGPLRDDKAHGPPGQHKTGRSTGYAPEPDLRRATEAGAPIAGCTIMDSEYAGCAALDKDVRIVEMERIAWSLVRKPRQRPLIEHRAPLSFRDSLAGRLPRATCEESQARDEQSQADEIEKRPPALMGPRAFTLVSATTDGPTRYLSTTNKQPSAKSQSADSCSQSSARAGVTLQTGSRPRRAPTTAPRRATHPRAPRPSSSRSRAGLRVIEHHGVRCLSQQARPCAFSSVRHDCFVGAPSTDKDDPSSDEVANVMHPAGRVTVR